MNSIFQKFETVRTLNIQKKRTNLDQKNFSKQRIMRNQQKRTNERKRRKGFWKFALFFFLIFMLRVV